MKQDQIFLLDICTRLEKRNTLNPEYIYINWQSRKVLGCAPLSLRTNFPMYKTLVLPLTICYLKYIYLHVWNDPIHHKVIFCHL